MKQLAIWFVQLLHFALLGFVVLTPFFNEPASLLLHSIVCPSIVLHWAMNSDVCALTLIEAQLRGVDQCETFLDKLVGTVYRLPQGLTDGKYLSWILIALTAVSVYKCIKLGLYKKVWEYYRPSKTPARI